MKVWKDKEGKWITPKEFASRFKKGVAEVTPVQQVASMILFTWITIIGILCGVVVSIIAWDKMWWVFIILLAALGNTLVGLIGNYQRYTQLKAVEAMFKQSLALNEKKEVSYAQ